ncbi:glycosyltransferase 87 family protein [Cellulomonas oligotrophica]|uniref:DUF2029 domain-containing protein n=1 Tax=Cellulomonas oligotrophica TaxID=931536 RepID=A0A7Y9JXY0_9CELL|nr:glycosyltransferase 87 family protein [Cellulomonas oligotrophica]NYD86117.1 hypothetical protein [Cellulomonas oligotrophica]GIG30875.1 hypothetical protein Col01nite_00340 [Cellulomonas oligotrophica]
MVVHAWLTWLGAVLLAEQSFGDVDLYREWVRDGLRLGWWPVVDEAWVYPAAALLPMLVPAVVGTATYLPYALAWCALVAALNAVAVAGLLRRRHGETAVLWWMTFLLLLGPAAIGRLDAVVAPLSVLALLGALRRPRVAAALVTLGAWVKVSPGAAIVPLALAARRPWRDVVAPAAAVCVVVVGTVAALGGLPRVTSFVAEQGERGLQIESVAATPWLVVGLWSDAVRRYLNRPLVTFEISGPGTQATADALGALLVVGFAAAAVLLWWCRRRDGERFWSDDALRLDLVLRGALLMALVLIVLNKVGSPQFMTWLAPPVAVALAHGLPRWGRVAAVVAAAAFVTQVAYPWFYADVVRGGTVVTLLLAARNVALVALLVATVVRLLRPAAGEELSPADGRTARLPWPPRRSAGPGTPSGAVGGEPPEQVRT